MPRSQARNQAAPSEFLDAITAWTPAAFAPVARRWGDTEAV